MIVEINADPAAIDWSPAGEIEEIVQNVRTILRTPRMSVPLDRAFGVDGRMVDMPITRAAAVYQHNIVAAVSRYEPRAEVLRVSFAESDSAAAALRPTVTVRLRLSYA